MGDRAVIVVKGNRENGEYIASCGVYLHGRGEDSVKLLKDAIPRMRKADPDYSTARLVGHLHNVIPRNVGLGVVPAPSSTGPRALSNISPGDAGVIVYDCITGRVQYAAGYLAEPDEGGERTYYAPDSLPVPPE